jgi:hypothetical protein
VAANQIVVVIPIAAANLIADTVLVVAMILWEETRFSACAQELFAAAAKAVAHAAIVAAAMKLIAPASRVADATPDAAMNVAAAAIMGRVALATAATGSLSRFRFRAIVISTCTRVSKVSKDHWISTAIGATLVSMKVSI